MLVAVPCCKGHSGLRCLLHASSFPWGAMAVQPQSPQARGAACSRTMRPQHLVGPSRGAPRAAPGLDELCPAARRPRCHRGPCSSAPHPPPPLPSPLGAAPPQALSAGPCPGRARDGAVPGPGGRRARTDLVEASLGREDGDVPVEAGAGAAGHGGRGARGARSVQGPAATGRAAEGALPGHAHGARALPAAAAAAASPPRPAARARAARPRASGEHAQCGARGGGALTGLAGRESPGCG